MNRRAPAIRVCPGSDRHFQNSVFKISQSQLSADTSLIARSWLHDRLFSDHKAQQNFSIILFLGILIPQNHISQGMGSIFFPTQGLGEHDL